MVRPVAKEGDHRHVLPGAVCRPPLRLRDAGGGGGVHVDLAAVAVFGVEREARNMSASSPQPQCRLLDARLRSARDDEGAAPRRSCRPRC
jgi:hypothetical protein